MAHASCQSTGNARGRDIRIILQVLVSRNIESRQQLAGRYYSNSDKCFD
jgi:hypothetical protein